MASLFFDDYSIEEGNHAPCNQDNENENRCDAVHLIFTPQSRFLIVLTPELWYIEPEEVKIGLASEYEVVPISEADGREQYTIQCPCCKQVFDVTEPETVCLYCGSLLQVDKAKYFPHFNPFPPGV